MSHKEAVGGKLSLGSLNVLLIMLRISTVSQPRDYLLMHRCADLYCNTTSSLQY